MFHVLPGYSLSIARWCRLVAGQWRWHDRWKDRQIIWLYVAIDEGDLYQQCKEEKDQTGETEQRLNHLAPLSR
jgi:hypothetical protein